MKGINYLIIFATVILFTNCKTVDLRFKLYNPPMVSLPDHVKQIALVNRTIIDSTQKDKNLIEAIITGESFLGDKQGPEDCLFSFRNYFNNYGPVPSVIPDKHKLYGNIGSFQNEPLNWALVKKICRESKSNALMSLERFDTNSDATIGAVKSGVDVINNAINTGNLNMGVKDIRYHVQYTWKLYDTLNQQIVYSDDQVVHEIARGVPMLAPLPIEAVKNTAVVIGEREASKFASTFYWVHRDYYKKGKSAQFKIGFRRAMVNDWDGAIDIWKQTALSSNSKTAGRSCYNIAIAYEVKGDLTEALKWARKSYSDYGTKLAHQYVYTLERRVNNGN